MLRRHLVPALAALALATPLAAAPFALPPWEAYSAHLALDGGEAFHLALESFDDPAGPRQVRLTSSAEGEHWTTPRPLAGDHYSAGSPWLLATPSGLRLFLHVQFEAQRPYQLAHSRLLEGSWTAPVPLELAPTPGSAGHRLNPSLVARKDGSLVMAFQELSSAGGRVLVATSEDGGQSWGPPTPVLAGVALPRLGLAPSGDLLLVTQGRLQTGAFELILSRSSDAVTWTRPAQLSEGLNCHDASFVAAPGGGVRLYYISTLGNTGPYEVVRRDSPDGVEFGPLERLTANGVPDHQPHAVRRRDGTEVLVWGQQGAAGHRLRFRSRR